MTIFVSAKDKEKDDAADGFERCCLCHRKTDVPVSLPIDLRKYYVEGAGQLCADCFHKVYTE